jgi:hypothetical protein
MARKEQDRGRQQSKSRAAMRQGAHGAAAAPQPVAATPSPKARGSKSSRSGAVVASCICASAYQDEKYGSGRRVFNVGPGGGKCTVCGAKKQI